MSAGNSIERAKMMAALGAEVVIVPQAPSSTPGQVSGAGEEYLCTLNGFFLNLPLLCNLSRYLVYRASFLSSLDLHLVEQKTRELVAVC